MHRHLKTACLVAVLTFPLVTPPVAHAGATIFVTTITQEINDNAECSLQEAIYAANFDDNKAPDLSSPGQFVTTACEPGDGADVIELPHLHVFSYADPIEDADNFAGPSVTPIITSTITIEGRGARLERVSAGRPTRAFVVGPTGFLDLREVHVEGFFIRGGNGGLGGGGGGMGAGGAIYVQGGRLLVQWSTFEGNGVRGGNGGDEGIGLDGGGGGGLSGNGGNADYSGGGGGGSRGDGGHALDLSLDYRGGGGGGRVTSGFNQTPGQPCGGAGGDSTFAIGGDGDDAEYPLAGYFCDGGGGGGGSGTSDLLPGNGGSGSYGGGGGGGGGSSGISSGDGGDGGFDVGGGGASDNQGGHGGFGGGGGRGFEAFSEGRGQGGSFAGDGDQSGGGGAGLGGAIFGYRADIDIVNSTFTENWAEWGRPGIACGFEGCNFFGANSGRGAGGAIFTVAGDLRVENSTIAGNAAITVTNGGGGGIVVYQPVDPDDNGYASFVLRNSIVAYNGAAECYTRNGVTTSGSEANIITDSSSNNLGNPPCPGVVDDPLLEDLAYNPPGTTPTMKLGAGSPAIDAAVGAFPADDQRGVLRPQGAAADIGAFELTSLPPTTTIALAPATPNGSNDWYLSAVAVTITASDPENDVAQTRCVLDPATAPSAFADLPDAACTLTGVSADGQHTIYAASSDDQGNLESPVVSAAFMLDGTAPTLSPSLNVPSPITVGQTGVEASPNASDATSGIASSSCEAVDTSTPGVHTVSCTATDNAGNTAEQDLTYLVEYRILGFFEPVPYSHWKVGQRVPVKVALADGAGVRISDAEAAALAAACRVTFQASGAQSRGPDCMKYDALKDQFVYTWKLGKRGTGAATIVVRISYPGTAVQTGLSESITIMP